MRSATASLCSLLSVVHHSGWCASPPSSTCPLQNRAVVIIANLKPRNMRGIKSNGMVLCASNEEHTAVEPLTPPEGAAVGERVWFGEASEQGEPAKPNQVVISHG